MRRLLLLRHAEAVPARGGRDIDRALSPRGMTEAEQAGYALTQGGWAPEAALVSTAARTRQTYETLARVAASPAAVLLEARLYAASADAILALVQAVPSTVRTLLVIGHNPGLAAAALRVARSGEPTDRARLAAAFPTGGLAVVRFEVDTWTAAPQAGGHLDALIWPQ